MKTKPCTVSNNGVITKLVMARTIGCLRVFIIFMMFKKYHSLVISTELRELGWCERWYETIQHRLQHDHAYSNRQSRENWYRKCTDLILQQYLYEIQNPIRDANPQCKILIYAIAMLARVGGSCGTRRHQRQTLRVAIVCDTQVATEKGYRRQDGAQYANQDWTAQNKTESAGVDAPSES